MFKYLSTVGLLLAITAAAAIAQDGAPPTATLKNGDDVTLDAIKSADWIQGTAPSEWEKGKVYMIVGFSQFLIVVFLAKKDRFEFLQLMASGLSCQKYEGQKHDASMDTWFFG